MRLPFLLLFSTLAACGARSSLPVPDAGGDGGAGGSAGGAGGVGGDPGGGGVGGVEQLALGAAHSCLRTFSGEVYCWGSNTRGQLGSEVGDGSLEPVAVDLPEPATYLAAGSYHTCAILEDRTLYCWGWNRNSQLGVASDAEEIATPVELDLSPFDDSFPESIALGERHSCAILRDGAQVGYLVCWGDGGVGQIGPNGNSALPTRVASFVDQVACGAFHTCFIGAEILECMGSNEQLQAGVAGPSQLFDPTMVDLIGPVDLVRSGRGQHTCARESGTGTLFCWGDNDAGQLGLGFRSEAELPTPVTDLSTVTDVAPGFAHTCALEDGVVSCWGDNGSGQLGVAGMGFPSPVEVPGATSMIAVGTGTVHSCGYRSPTEIFCWGGNDFGQLGDGTTQSSNVPKQVNIP
ncbi:MAG: hypothetical protein U0271_44165 [Polyangiaceae bacterium]